MPKKKKIELNRPEKIETPAKSYRNAVNFLKKRAKK